MLRAMSSNYFFIQGTFVIQSLWLVISNSGREQLISRQYSTAYEQFAAGSVGNFWSGLNHAGLEILH